MTVTQPGNVGGYTVSTCVAGGVTVATAPTTTTGALTVTPVAAGTCVFTITGTNRASASLPVTVTTTGIVTN